ncbi:MAG TPA: murein biosynthesis integral membrane protein MurJ [Sedimentibacter sp.]|nr:murein biosynthesis integral membrane protein MurJ [Sedimentibacter sp.]
MSEVRQAAKSVLIIIIFSLGSKLLGLAREILVAAKFGSGVETDAYFVAITAVMLITSLAGTSINTTMIPILSEIEAKEGKTGKKKHTNNFINIMLVISLIIVVVGVTVAPVIIRILASGFRGEQFELAVLLTRIGFPVVFFSNTLFIIRGYLQTESYFADTAASNIPYNLVFIVFLLFFSSKYGISGLMITSIIAVASQITFQIPGIKKTNFRYELFFDIGDKYLRKMLYLVPPVILGVAINDLNTIVDRTIASNLISGSISALDYASKLNGMMMDVFVAAITTVIFPLLSKESSYDNYDEMKRFMGYGVNVILLITIPATVGLIILSKPIVQVVFERGAFDATATVMTSKALLFYSIGLTAIALNSLLTRVFYSLQDTKTPMFYGAISVMSNVVLNLILVRYMAHSGLALATSIAITIATILMFIKLKKRIGSMGTYGYIKCVLKSGFASAIMGAIVYIIYNGLNKLLGNDSLSNLILLMTSISVGVVVYIIICYLIGVNEVKVFFDKVKQRIANYTKKTC